MTPILSPRLVLVAGVSASGKSTISRSLALKIVNGIHLNRDSILYGGLLCVDAEYAAPNLPAFREYVARDNVYPHNVEAIETPFGPMTRVNHDPPSDYHARHSRDQGYLIAGRLAAENLALGKVPIVDGFQARHINGGSLKKFINQPCFYNFPTYLIFVSVSEEECYRRLVLARPKEDNEAGIRGRPYKDYAEFRKLYKKQTPSPEKLAELRHLIINTTHRSISDCVEECLVYVQEKIE